MRKRGGATVANVRAWIKRGDGQGQGKDYRPFLRVRDVPSKGRSAMVLGIKTGRVHHYLSDLEYYHHVLAEYDPGVIDIREQYALLPWEETQEIAETLGIKHPTYPGTTTPIVVTSDIVLTKTNSPRIRVISTKPASELDPANANATRTFEKLLIEQTYWKRREDASWHISTERHLSRIRVRNLDLLRPSVVRKDLDWLSKYQTEFVHLFNRCWRRDVSLIELLRTIGRKLTLSEDDCFMLFGRGVWLRLIDVDLDSEAIDHHFPLRRLVA